MPTMGLFVTLDGLGVPAVTASEMWRVDDIAVGEFELTILQMMENAGRTLAQNAMDMAVSPADAIVVLAGGGGNGGGGLCAARHLLNRGFSVIVGLGTEVEALRGPALARWRTLLASDVIPADVNTIHSAIHAGALVVDALVGYGLHGPMRGRIADLVSICNVESARVLSLDVPSGWDATSGDRGSVAVAPEHVLPLRFPRPGWRECGPESA